MKYQIMICVPTLGAFIRFNRNSYILETLRFCSCLSRLSEYVQMALIDLEMKRLFEDKDFDGRYFEGRQIRNICYP